MQFVTRFPKTVELLEKARADTYSAYAVGLSYGNDRIFAHGGCGPRSLFDLASVSKVLCTTTLVALASERGLLSVDEPVQATFPAFKDSRVKISHLLNHTSGLPAWLPLHAHFHEENGPGHFDPRTTPREARSYYEAEIMKSANPEAFEKEAVYSDLGFMLLGWLLEIKTESLLDALFQEWIVLPAKTPSLQFLPTSPDVVPTEDCPWRKRVLRGEVHDDNTYVLGGVAGHAGVFGDVEDVIKLATHWLDAVHGRPALIKPETARLFFSKTHVPSSTRVLGWDGVSATGSSAGRFFSPESRGHLGYTGTSLWIDPKRELIVTLLTNRVHPTRTNEKIRAFRPLFHDSLLTELGIS